MRKSASFVWFVYLFMPASPYQILLVLGTLLINNVNRSHHCQVTKAQVLKAYCPRLNDVSILTSFVTWGKTFIISVSQSLHLWNGNNSITPIGLLTSGGMACIMMRNMVLEPGKFSVPLLYRRKPARLLCVQERLKLLHSLKSFLECGIQKKSLEHWHKAHWLCSCNSFSFS